MSAEAAEIALAVELSRELYQDRSRIEQLERTVAKLSEQYQAGCPAKGLAERIDQLKVDLSKAEHRLESRLQACRAEMDTFIGPLRAIYQFCQKPWLVRSILILLLLNILTLLVGLWSLSLDRSNALQEVLEQALMDHTERGR